MAHPPHTLDCLEVAGNLIYCKVTGESSSDVSKFPKHQEPTPFRHEPAPYHAKVIPFPSTSRELPARGPAAPQASASPATPPTPPTRKRLFMIYGPDERTRWGGNPVHPYSIKTMEEARAKAFQLLARMTRTPYLTIKEYGASSSLHPIQHKILRSELPPATEKDFYVIYGRDYDLQRATQVAKAGTLGEIKKLGQAYLKENPQLEKLDVYHVTPGRGLTQGRHATTIFKQIKASPGESGNDPMPTDMSRANVIRIIREGLRKRSGKDWSVTGGSGTAYGWLRIQSPPKRQVKGSMTDEDMKELAQLLGLIRVHHQGESVPSGGDYYVEYVDRAWGRPPRKRGEQYWD